MRFIFFLGALAPVAFACDNPDTDACASAFTASAAAAITFCKTYTTASQTTTTSLPAFATYCSDKPSKLSSACSCLAPGATVTGTTLITHFIKCKNYLYKFLENN
jgi:polygalacturonase